MLDDWLRRTGSADSSLWSIGMAERPYSQSGRIPGCRNAAGCFCRTIDPVPPLAVGTAGICAVQPDVERDDLYHVGSSPDPVVVGDPVGHLSAGVYAGLCPPSPRIALVDGARDAGGCGGGGHYVGRAYSASHRTSAGFAPGLSVHRVDGVPGRTGQ